MFLDTVSKFLCSEKLTNSNIAIAISGGADSVSLFFVLQQLSHKYSLTLSLVHVNYNLRGADSLADEQFVRTLAENHDIPFFIKSISLGNDASGIEERARDIRYEFFREVQKEGFPFIAIGHTREDQVETVLFRLMRGTGLHGAEGMMGRRGDGIIRPMLEAGREECRLWLIDQGISWREDKSNQENDYTRNYIRNELLPLLPTVNKGAVQHIAQFAQRCGRAENELLSLGMESLIQRDLWQEPTIFHFDKKGGIRYSESYAIMQLLRERSCSLEEKNVALLNECASHAGKITLLPAKWKIYSSYKKIIFFHESTPPFVNFSKQTVSVHEDRIQHGIYRLSSVHTVLHNKASLTEGIQYEPIANIEDVSKWTKKLKKKGVPASEREFYPLFKYVKSDSSYQFVDLF